MLKAAGSWGVKRMTEICKLRVEEWLVLAVMTMYEKARTVVRTKDENSEEFDENIGVHQGSILSPLLFAVVMEAMA